MMVQKRKEKENMSAIIVNQDNFNSLKNEHRPVLLDFYADWCGPCRMVLPIIEKLAEESDEYVIAKVNVDKYGELAREFGIISIPTLIVMKNGLVVNKAVGAKSREEILKLIYS